MKKRVDDPGGRGSPAARKKQKTVPSPEEKEKKKDQRGKGGRLYVEGCKKDECTTRWL